MKVAVLGSVNLDLVATVAHLPAPGETVTGATLARYPGGKGANQALAARRLGAEVALIGRVGDDAYAKEALTLLRAEGVDLSGCVADPQAPTGVALIAVVPGGDNQIVVAPGANAAFAPALLPAAIEADALICQLELPVETVAAAVERFEGFVTLNLAPAADVPDALLARADLIVVNDGEAAFYGSRLDRGLVAVTHGAEGATLKRDGKVVATAKPPAVDALDTVGAGDCFVSALTLSLGEREGIEAKVRFACAAGAAATMRPGAQPALPTRAEVERLL